MTKFLNWRPRQTNQYRRSYAKCEKLTEWYQNSWFFISLERPYHRTLFWTKTTRDADIKNKCSALCMHLFGQNPRSVQHYRCTTIRYTIWPIIADFAVNKNVFVFPWQIHVPTNFGKDGEEKAFRALHRHVKRFLNRRKNEALWRLDLMGRIRRINVPPRLTMLSPSPHTRPISTILD